MIYLVVGGGKTKVGFTSKPARLRLGDLQVGSPAKLKLVLEAEGNRSMERKLKRVLSERHSHNEWFHGEVTLTEAKELVERARQCSDFVTPEDAGIRLCECHDLPMRWNPQVRNKNGGYWRCRIKEKEVMAAHRRKRGVLERSHVSSAEIRQGIIAAVGFKPGSSWTTIRDMADGNGEKFLQCRDERARPFVDDLLSEGLLVNTNRGSLKKNPGKAGRFRLWLPGDVPKHLLG